MQTKRAKLRRTPGWLKSASKRLFMVLVLSSAATQFVGCTAWTGLNNSWKYNGYWNQTMMGHRIKTSASRAWHCRKHHFCNQKYLKEFAAGFKAGYTDVADGGTGCTPAFPPREYWGWKYQSCEGQARVAAWFSGYPHGARAAEEDGIGNWTQIQTSSAIQQQYAQNGMLQQNYAGIYPIPETAVPNGLPPRDLPRELPLLNEGIPSSGYSVSVEDGVIEGNVPQSVIQY
jgi:hypothetical protein